MVDVIVRAVDVAIGEATLNLRPAPRIRRILHEQRDARIALQVLEPASVGATIEPDLAIAILVPDRVHLDAAVATRGTKRDEVGLVEECFQTWAELKGHA